ncbi:hypothetical protein CCP93_00875 [Campylobacter upsaliensis]|nr:hypothetical protein [Campylobacter upsaliensis]
MRKFKTLAYSARVIHFRNLKRLRRFFSKGLNCFVMKGFKFLKSKFRDKTGLFAEQRDGLGFRCSKLRANLGLLR